MSEPTYGRDAACRVSVAFRRALCKRRRGRRGGLSLVTMSPLAESTVRYVKFLLSGFTAVLVSLFVPGIVPAFRAISSEKATGIGVLWAGLLEAAFSLRFWALASVLFLLFIAASRLKIKALRIVAFWIPVLLVSAVGVGMIALIAYLHFHFREG